MYIYSVEFPQMVLVNHTALSNLKQVQRDKSSYLYYQVGSTVSEQAYANWCNNVTTIQTTSQNSTNKQSIVKLLKSFDVANSTPMQALEFVANLKTLL